MAAELTEAQSAKVLRSAYAHALEADAEHRAAACLAFVQAVGCLSARSQQEKAAFLSRLQSEDTLTKPDPEDSKVRGTLTGPLSLQFPAPRSSRVRDRHLAVVSILGKQSSTSCALL